MKYDPDRFRCPKCGHTKGDDKYVQVLPEGAHWLKSVAIHGESGEWEEKIKTTCRNCGFPIYRDPLNIET